MKNGKTISVLITTLLIVGILTGNILISGGSIPTKNSDYIYSGTLFETASPSNNHQVALGSSPTIVNITPPTQVVSSGQSFSVHVFVTPSQPIRGVDFNLSFNASLLEAVNVTEGDLFNGFYSYFNFSSINNTVGEIVYIHGVIVTLGNVSTPGIFANISFNAKQELGVSFLNLTDVHVVNETDLVDVEIYNGSVTVVAGIAWDAMLTFSETGGETTDVVFGEAADANDGAPADIYDSPLSPGTPTPPYLRSWFNDSLLDPFTYLWKDYRDYPDTYKVWNLSIQWRPVDTVTNTTVTISWDTDDMNGSEYDSIILYNDTDVSLVDMINDKSYVFTCQAVTWQNYTNFTIICSKINQPPIISGETPQDNKGNIDIMQATVNVSIGDPEGDTFNWTIEGLYIVNTGQTNDINGSKSANLVTPLPYTTDIIWYVNSTDGKGWTNVSYNFTSRAQYLPDPPSDFTATTYNKTTINLSWNKNSMTDQTYIERNDTPSWSRGDGTNIYNGTESSYQDKGLVFGTQYFYQAWSWNDTDMLFSTSYVECNTSTFENQPPSANFTYEPYYPTIQDIIYFNSTSFDLDGIIVNWTWDLDDGTIVYGEFVTHQFANIGIYTVILKVRDDDDAVAEADTSIEIMKPDTISPTAVIIRPMQAIYITDKIMRPFYFAFIIGEISIDVYALDAETGIERIEFYIDDVHRKTLYEEPYRWLWDEKTFFIHTIMVRVYDNAGNSASDAIPLWIFNFDIL